MTYEVHNARNEASDLQTAIAGRVHAAGDSGYDAARRPWQRKFDPHPALVVEATSATDVQAALRFARERGLPFSVQGGSGESIFVPLRLEGKAKSQKVIAVAGTAQPIGPPASVTEVLSVR